MIENKGKTLFTEKKGGFGETHPNADALFTHSSFIRRVDVTIRTIPGLCIVEKMIATKTKINKTNKTTIMKKFLLAGLFAFVLSATSFAASNEANSKAVAHLETAYTNAKDVSWVITSDYQKASFTIGNEKTDVYYNADGEILGSSKTMAYDKLPKAALETLSSEYTFPDYQLKDCIKFTDATDHTSYFVSFDNENENIILKISDNGVVSLADSNE